MAKVVDIKSKLNPEIKTNRIIKQTVNETGNIQAIFLTTLGTEIFPKFGHLSLHNSHVCK